VPDPTPPPDWAVTCVVGRADGPEVLVDAGGDGLQLPMVGGPVAIEPFAAAAVEAVEALLGTPVVPLRLTWLPADGWLSGSIVVELEPLDEAPAGFQWRDPDGLIDLIEPAEARAVVQRRQAGIAATAATLAPPWSHVGWMAQASAWMVERMAEAGMAPIDGPRLVYQGPLAAVLRASSSSEACYLKCATRAFAHEAAITAVLARQTPGGVPDVVVHEPLKNWLLMRDHGGVSLDADDGADWVSGLAVAAALQRSSIGATGALTAAGAQVRPLERLVTSIPEMLDRGDLGGRLAPETRDAWVASIPRFLDACAALLDLSLPETLVHGDLHPGNIVVGPRGHVVVDWSDAAVGHPFVDLPTFLLRTKDADLRGRLRDAYVGAWADLVPRPRLEVAAELAMAVGAVYQVASYQALLPALDAPERAVFASADVRWAERALDGLHHGLDAGIT
jgi:Phosphotransferase enzyme family